MNRINMILTVWCVLVATSCWAQTSATAPTQPGQDDVRAIVDGNNAFAIDLYGQLAAGRGNLFFSPHSVRTALAMTYGGATGRTAEQMAKVLQLPCEEFVGHRVWTEEYHSIDTIRQPWEAARLHSAFAASQRAMELPKDSKNELTVANALWGQKGYSFKADFLELLRKSYGSPLEQVDFQGATEDARAAINAWVEKQTRDKIKDLIAQGVLDRNTRLVLTNAIYFKGVWASPFKPKATKDEDFRLGGGKTVKTPMMNQTGDFGFFETDAVKILQLPYADNELSMTLLLPVLGDEPELQGAPGGKKQGGAVRDPLEAVKDLEKQLTAAKLAEWTGRLRTVEVQVAIPKFKSTSQFQLAQPLKAMGMTDAFDPDAADFSGMTGSKELFISAVVHKAFVDVNEEGTEAAAATGVVIGLTAVRIPKVFRADHPFLYLIRHEKTGAILFVGRMESPG